MKHAETVTFGGSALERAAEQRANARDLQGDEAAQNILFWRGKPMMDGTMLARVPSNHDVLRDADDERVFLGTDESGPIFAANLSKWTPDDLDEESINTFLDPTEQHHPKMPETSVFMELRANMTSLTPRDAELAATARGILEWHRTHGFCATCGAKSTFAMGGWERECHACGRKHFPRTDPVVIMLITHGNNVLVGRSPGWPDGMYSLLAGFVEPGETLEAAVRREVFEEAGVRVGEVNYLASQPWPFPASLMFGCAGIATTDKITIDPAEIEDARWVSREAMTDVFAGQHPDILPARKGAIAHFLLENWLADTLD